MEGLHRGIPHFLFSQQDLSAKLQKWCWHVGLTKMTKRKVINDFLTRLGLCAEDPMYTKDPRIFNEFYDATKFVVYGEVKSSVRS